MTIQAVLLGAIGGVIEFVADSRPGVHGDPASDAGPGGGEALCVAAAGGRELAWDGCVNVRDLGGLGQVRPGSVVRMEAPGRLTEAGWAAAWAYGSARSSTCAIPASACPTA